MRNFLDIIQSKWSTFNYNFGWARYVGMLDGWIPRLALLVPVVGYLIIFNDTFARSLTFNELTSGHKNIGLSGSARLKFLYLGLVSLGAANIIYKLKRPYIFKLAQDSFSFNEVGIKNFTLEDYIRLNGNIRGSGSAPLTQHGKYYDREWDTFMAYATGDQYHPETAGKSADWTGAKAKNEGLLRNILTETFFRENTRTRRPWLILCLGIAAVGYALLAIPSIDLFLKVMAAILFPM